jgi:hypothetical protein
MQSTEGVEMTESIHTTDIDRMNEFALERRQQELCEPLDGADIIAVLLTCADHLEYTGLQEFIENDRLARDLINGTQSNTEQAWELIREWARLDEELARRGEDD